MHIQLHCLIYFLKEPIVEVKVHVDVSIASCYNGTPMPMIVILDQDEVEMELTQVSVPRKKLDFLRMNKRKKQ